LTQKLDEPFTRYHSFLCQSVLAQRILGVKVSAKQVRFDQVDQNTWHLVDKTTGERIHDSTFTDDHIERMINAPMPPKSHKQT